MDGRHSIILCAKQRCSFETKAGAGMDSEIAVSGRNQRVNQLATHHQAHGSRHGNAWRASSAEQHPQPAVVAPNTPWIQVRNLTNSFGGTPRVGSPRSLRGRSAVLRKHDLRTRVGHGVGRLAERDHAVSNMLGLQGA